MEKEQEIQYEVVNDTLKEFPPVVAIEYTLEQIEANRTELIRQRDEIDAILNIWNTRKAKFIELSNEN